MNFVGFVESELISWMVHLLLNEMASNNYVWLAAEGHVLFVTVKNFLNSSLVIGITYVASWICLLSFVFATVRVKLYLSISVKKKYMLELGLNFKFVQGARK